jgi:hypothetical protein
VLNKKEVNTKKNKLVQVKHELISPVLKNNLFRLEHIDSSNQKLY